MKEKKRALISTCHFVHLKKKEHLKSLLESPRCALHKTSKLKKINEKKCEIVQLG